MGKLFKSKTQLAINKLNETHGLDKTIEVAYKMLESENHKEEVNFKATIHGEVCESILEIIIKNYISKNSDKTKDWKVYKGIILVDVNKPESEYFTEIDFILTTPNKIFVIECKSYGGDKEILPVCKIKVKSKVTDIFGQNFKHLEALEKILGVCKEVNPQNVKEKYFQLVLFNFSLGNLIDKRDDKQKSIMISTYEKDFIEKIESCLNDKILWDVKAVDRFMEILDKGKDKFTSKHLDYVKGLRSKRKNEIK